MKKTKQLTTLTLAAVTLLMSALMCISASAATEQAYSCRVSGEKTHCTETHVIKSTKDNQYYWSWASPPTDRDYVVHRLNIHDYKDDIIGDELLTYEGTTHQAATYVASNNYYHVNIRRQFYFDTTLRLKGTWGFVD